MAGFGIFARLIWLVQGVVFFALFIVWVFAILKALKGEWFKIPLIGNFAQKQARANRPAPSQPSPLVSCL